MGKRKEPLIAVALIDLLEHELSGTPQAKPLTVVLDCGGGVHHPVTGVRMVRLVPDRDQAGVVYDEVSCLDPRRASRGVLALAIETPESTR